MPATATKKELEKRVKVLESDMLAMNEMVSRLMMGKLLTELVSEIRVWIHEQGVEALSVTAIEWISQPTALEKAVQEVMVEANDHFKDRTAGLNVWEELKGYMTARLFLRLEKSPPAQTSFETH